MFEDASKKSKNVYVVAIVSAFLFFMFISLIACDYTPYVSPTEEEKLESQGYTLLELEDVGNIWYKNLSNGVTRYIEQETISHYTQAYLDIYFYIDVDSSNNKKLGMSTATQTDSYLEAFVPEYVIFQHKNQHSTSEEGKIRLYWGDTDYSYYNSYGEYNVWCESSVLNDNDLVLNNLIEMLEDEEEGVNFYFATNNKQTYLNSLAERFRTQMRDILYTYVNYDDQLIYRN